MIAARIAIALVALTGCTASMSLSDREARAERELAKALEGRVAGEPVNCIHNERTNSPQIIDADTILYGDNGTIWRNELPSACPGMSPDDLLVVELWGSDLCRNDLITPVHRGSSIPGPRCRLGQFTPYKKVK